MLALQRKTLATCDHHVEVRTVSKKCGDVGCPGNHMLKVVEEKQEVAVADSLGGRAAAERSPDRRHHVISFGECRQRHPPHAMLVVFGHCGCDLERETCLATPAGAGHGDQ